MSEANNQLERTILEDVIRALEEDIGTGDLSAKLIPPDQNAIAHVALKDRAVICGQPWFDQVFNQLSDKININWLVKEGELKEANNLICKLSGPARSILSGERTALNFIQTLSSTATTAYEFTSAVKSTNTVILDTRKTLPGLRIAQKYAVRIGGAMNHRMGLHDAIMIKENHIAACGSVENAIKIAHANSNGKRIIIEVETTDDAKNALESKVDRLLLDDFKVEDMRTIVELRKKLSLPIELEASGGVSIDNVKEIAKTGVDFISIGSLTKDINAIDLSMRFEF
ncbi:MAG: carboxylating nicotinate-nucleotide diphosphorylase [Pseudomonadota bacterium]|nr:carboxylating nicotinate-nucleotide diphosphorylase [Pseudomonadota bacterium]